MGELEVDLEARPLGVRERLLKVQMSREVLMAAAGSAVSAPGGVVLAVGKVLGWADDALVVVVATPRRDQLMFGLGEVRRHVGNPDTLPGGVWVIKRPSFDDHL